MQLNIKPPLRFGALKFSPSHVLAAVYRMLFILLIAFFIVLIAFMYLYLYQTITQTRAITELSANVIKDKPDVALYNQVTSRIEEKKLVPDSHITHDPFQPFTSASPSP